MSIVITEPHPGVRLVTMDRPSTKNALDLASYRELTTGLRAADADEGVHAIILTGANGTFSSGNDLADFVRYSDPTPALDLLRSLVLVETPLLAAVEGAAIGIGATILLHCDLAVAAESATFRMPFVPLGLTPEGGSSYLLPKVSGSKLAAEILLLGDPFTADVAERAGLINTVVAEGEALSTALGLAARLGEQPPQALRAAHRLLHRDRDRILAVIDEEVTMFTEKLKSDEAQTILKSFSSGSARR